jgi:hypothetical protein
MKIINQDESLVVPEKTIVFFPKTATSELKKFKIEDIGLFLKPLNADHKRDWFTPHFYKCLPLSIGNMQGFAFSLPYTISVFWNGGSSPNDLVIRLHEDFKNYEGYEFIRPTSDFGHGILTLDFPITLKTPPGINLMTIAPPNYPVPGLSPMTGVVESDNIRFSFTLNIKVDLQNIEIIIAANTPIIGLLPIPRYFCDSFELASAYDIFDKEVVEEELNIVYRNSNSRNQNNNKINEYAPYSADRLYYSGQDFDGNKFKDHQLPKKKNKI